jgi:hypothetical protein
MATRDDRRRRVDPTREALSWSVTRNGFFSEHESNSLESSDPSDVQIQLNGARHA